MKRMRIRRATLVLAAGYWQFVSVPMVRADVFTVTRHDAFAFSGAHLFPALVPRVVFDASSGPDDTPVEAIAEVLTTVDGSGHYIGATARSSYSPSSDALDVSVSVLTRWSPPPQGPGEGGPASASIRSIIEFPLPAPGERT